MLLFAAVVAATAATSLGATGDRDSRLLVTLPSLHGYDHTAGHIGRPIADRASWCPLSFRPTSVTAGRFAGFGVAAKAGGARFVVDSAGETRIFVRAGHETLEVSRHAARRITQRRLTVDKVEAVVNDSQPFRYYHAGTWKTGYYDSGSRVFVGSSKGTITTVVNDASPNYINNLRAARP